MENYISIFILLPLIGFIVNGIIPGRDEKRIALSSLIMLGLQFVFVSVFTIIWLFNGATPLYKDQIHLIELHDFQLIINFIFDEVTAVYILVGSFIAFLIIAYSRNYLHREGGFKRFFSTVLFFYLGYSFIILSGNLTSIFIGWEIVGISSFLLIAFYRDRFIPVKNAIFIFSIYKLGDIALMLALWMGHIMWNDSITLEHLNDISYSQLLIQNMGIFPTLFSLSIFLAAAVKSAQFPFSTWLPRAMEGPTPSSAIFYSSLAVHLGILLLIRTYAFWSLIPLIRILLIASGVFGFIISIIMARIQPTIKGQIAYSIVAQTGLMAVEIALGWHYLALIHFASHAMLRSYQLLISPSIVGYLNKKMFFEFIPLSRKRRIPFFQNISNSIYILSLNEWFLDKGLYFFIWGIFKKTGNFFHFIPFIAMKWIFYISLIFVPGLTYLVQIQLIGINKDYLIYSYLILSLFFILRVFAERNRVLYAWYKIGSFHLFLSSAMILNGTPINYILIYSSGIFISYFLGHIALFKIRKKEKLITLNGYSGHYFEYPVTEFWFLISALGLMSFPITPAFIGIELFLSGIHKNQPLLLFMIITSFYINSIAMVRIYSRIFLGPHIKTYHSIARKTS